MRRSLSLPALTPQEKDNDATLDLEYVQLNVPKVLGILNKYFRGEKKR